MLLINISSDQPHQIIKQLTKYHQQINTTNPEHENVLLKSGYKSNFKYSEENYQCNSKKRFENIIWFGPLFLRPVKTNVSGSLFRVLDKHVPKSEQYINSILYEQHIENHKTVQEKGF